MTELVKKLKSLPYTTEYILNVRYWLNYYGTRDLENFERLRISTKHKTGKQIWDMVQALPDYEFESSEIVTRSTGLELAKELEDYVNGNRNHAEFIDHIVNGTHRTLNQLIIGLFIKVMQAEAKTTTFDGRNEASVELCKRLNLDDVYLPYI